MNRFIYNLLLCVISFVLLSYSSIRAEQKFNAPDKTITFNKKSLKIAMFLPLAYDKIEELDFTKFNIEEKKELNIVVLNT